MKRIISLFLVIAVFFSPSGCSKSESAEDKKARVISEATAYLKENYPDDEFTYLEGRSPNSAYNYYELGFTSKNYDNQKVTVFGQTSEEKNDDGLTKFTYSDDYYQYYMLKDAEKYFYDVAKEYLGKNIVIKVSIQDGLASAKLVQNDKTFIDNLQNGNVLPFVYLFSLDSTEKNNDNINDFLNQLIKNNIVIILSYAYVNDFSEITNENIDNIRNDYDKYCIEKNTFSTSNGVINEY